MEADRRAEIIAVADNVLEQFAFMFCEPVPIAELPRPQEDLMHASMGFKGAVTGALELVAPVEFARQLAANALGIDEEDEQMDAAGDALRELLNMLCGQLLTTLGGAEPVFDLTIPEVVSCGLEAWDGMADDETTVSLLVDDLPVLLSVEWPD